MKKYLLTALLLVFGFVGAFASADYTFQGSLYGQTYTPSQLVLNEDLTINSSSVSYTLNDGQLMHNASFEDSNGVIVCDITYDDNSLSIFGNLTEGYCSLSAGTYNVIGGGEGTFGSLIISSFDSGNGGTEGGDSSSPLLSGGTAQLAPVINSIFSVMGEFIPYVVYISIGILVATLGFYAIKRLMNWMYGKIKKYFR